MLYVIPRCLWCYSDKCYVFKEILMLGKRGVTLYTQCTLETCQFKLRASFRKKSGKWKIGTMMGPHNCTSTLMSQDHRKLNYKLISQSIKKFVHADASVTPKLIIAHIKEKFNYTTTYRKVWLAKNAAIESIYGKWKESYNDLPQWLNVMKETMPGTVFDLKTQIGENGETQFHRLFWAFYPCIHGFKYCKPDVHVDGTWLYGKYKGTLSLAGSTRWKQQNNSNRLCACRRWDKGRLEFFFFEKSKKARHKRNICLHDLRQTWIN